MPAVATQTAVADRRRSATAAAAAANNIEVARPVRSNSGYGSLRKSLRTSEVQRDVVEEDDNEDEDEEDESESSSSSEESSVVRFADLSGKEWAAVGMLAIANLCSTIAFSCIAPFYPAEAQLKGLDASEIGVIFGAFELVMFIAAPFLGKYVSHLVLQTDRQQKILQQHC